MSRLPSSNSSNAVRYLTRPPERLVLEGYRHWTKSVVTQSPEPMDHATALYTDILGRQFAHPAISSLVNFLNTLGICARCPLHMFDAETPNICTDETLVLGIIAGIQNGDDRATELCLKALSCDSRCDDVAMAAGSFALLLKGANRTLLPIPYDAISAILSRRSVDLSQTQSPSTTLH